MKRESSGCLQKAEPVAPPPEPEAEPTPPPPVPDEYRTEEAGRPAEQECFRGPPLDPFPFWRRVNWWSVAIWIGAAAILMAIALPIGRKIVGHKPTKRAEIGTTNEVVRSNEVANAPSPQDQDREIAVLRSLATNQAAQMAELRKQLADVVKLVKEAQTSKITPPQQSNAVVGPEVVPSAMVAKNDRGTTYGGNATVNVYNGVNPSSASQDAEEDLADTRPTFGRKTAIANAKRRVESPEEKEKRLRLSDEVKRLRNEVADANFGIYLSEGTVRDMPNPEMRACSRRVLERKKERLEELRSLLSEKEGELAALSAAKR